jgi:hypothetical protein
VRWALAKNSNCSAEKIISMRFYKKIIAIVLTAMILAPSAFASAAGILPDCLQTPGSEFSDACLSINTFVELALNIGAFAFSVIGALALAALIYGGFMLVIAGGNSERVTKGWGAIFAAAIGLGMTFSGYILVSFIIKAIGAKEGLSLIP